MELNNMVNQKKQKHMQKLINKDGIIAALAIDQRGALKKMMGKYQETSVEKEQIEHFKSLVSEELTIAASSILLDPEFGLSAAKRRSVDTGLLLAYEKTGYDTTVPGRLPDLLANWSVKRLKEEGADAVKFLLYYDVDESKEINDQKRAFVERIGSECQAEGLPFYLELLSYDSQIHDNQSMEFARIKPRKVIEMMREFSNPRYQVDVLKVEVPVNMKYVEGYTTSEFVYTKEEAMSYFKEQSQVAQLPFIFLSAGVNAELFQETLRLAKQAGSKFNGVLCGRATWAAGVEVFIREGEAATKQWLRTVGLNNIQDLNETLLRTATPIVFDEY